MAKEKGPEPMALQCSTVQCTVHEHELATAYTYSIFVNRISP